MVLTRSPDARDKNRSFSGPPPSVAGSSTSEVVVPPAAQLKALLELKESSPDEFQTIIKCAMGAKDNSGAKENDTASETSAETSVSNGEMDTSSDGGSTVRELNRKLEEDSGDGNHGSVSMTGNSNVEDKSEWQTRKRSRRNQSGSSNSNTATKKGKVDTDLLVYIKGVNFDISKEASRHPIDFSRKLSQIAGTVGEVKLVKDNVRIKCLSLKQKSVLLSLTDWSGKVVTVSEPWVRSRSSTGRQESGTRMLRGVIFGVSSELTEAEIASEVNAQSARRIMKKVNGEKVSTGTVVVSFPENLPGLVYIGCLRYKVKPYIPQPIRCNKCQGYGHIAAYCKRQVRCVRCGKGHNLEDCPVKDNLAQAVCVNCKGQHSAAFKGCVKYQEVSQALKITVTDKVSYRDALLKVRSDVLQRPGEVTVGRPVQTSTPLPAAARPTSTSALPPARRELFQPRPVEGVQTSEPAQQMQAATAKPSSDDDAKKNSSPAKDYLKEITHYLLYILAVLDGDKPNSDIVQIRRSLTDLACRTFGKHGSSPCLSPSCRKVSD